MDFHARTFLLEQEPAAEATPPPPICPEFARLLRAWYDSPDILADLALAELCQHSAHCLKCLRRHNWYAERGRVAVHPELSIEDINNA